MANDQLTTSKVLRLLEKRSLSVSRNMIGQDIWDKYLPPPVWDRQNPKEEGRWEEWAYRRAVYLYRLRKRGISGELLKVLLFYKDGWGWEEVKPICLDGLQKLILIQSSPVRKHLRKPNPTNVEFCIEDIVEETNINPMTAGFIFGVGLFGKPLADGSLQHFFSTFRDIYYSSSDDKDKRFFELMVSCIEHLTVELGLSWEEIEKLVETADDTKADRARVLLNQQFFEFRQILRQHNIERNVPKETTNFLTFFGKSKKELAKLFRTLPKRITTAQLLASCLAPAFGLEHIENQAREALSETAPNLIPLLNSQGEIELEPDKVFQEAARLMNSLKNQAETEAQLNAVELLQSMFNELESAISISKKE